MSPPDETKPTEPGGNVGLVDATSRAGTHDQYTAEPVPGQAGAGVVGAKTFADIIKNSTPSDLLLMAALHRKYAPQERLPAKLQRAIGEAWVARARGVR